MKKFFSVLPLLIGVLYFTDCKKGGSTPSSNQAAYIGKWSAYESVSWERQFTTEPYHIDTAFGIPGEYLNIKADGTATEREWTGSRFDSTTVYYKVIGDSLVEPNFPDGSKIAVSGNTLSISYNNEPHEKLFWYYKK